MLRKRVVGSVYLFSDYFYVKSLFLGKDYSNRSEPTWNYAMQQNMLEILLSITHL